MLSYLFFKYQVTTVTCSLGNPFKKQSEISLIIQLSDAGNLTLVDSFDVTTQLKTSSVQKDHDQVFSYATLVRVQAQIKLSGYTSNSQRIVFGGEVIGESAVEKPSQAGMVITHSYEVENFGVTEIPDVGLKISWPANMINGKWLLYLLSIVVTTSSSQEQLTPCEIPTEIDDPLELYSSQSTRRKRATDRSNIAGPEISGVTSEYKPETDLKCPNYEGCKPIVCPLGSLFSKEKFFVKIQTIVWNSTFIEEYKGISLVNVASSASVTNSHDNIKYGDSSVTEWDVFTTIEGPTLAPPKQEISIWLVFGATAVGVVLLVFLVLILWRCGFFERKHSVGYHNAFTHEQASKQASKNADFSQTTRLQTY